MATVTYHLPPILMSIEPCSSPDAITYSSSQQNSYLRLVHDPRPAPMTAYTPSVLLPVSLPR